jgi:hypothetical protein
MKKHARIGTLVLLALLTASGCGKDKDAVLARGLSPNHTIGQGDHQSNPPVAPAQSPAASADALFAAQYKYVNLVCAAYSTDSQTLAADAQPTATFAQQVYPVLNNSVSQSIQSPSGRLRAELSIATSLSTAMIQSGAAPVVVAVASATVQFNGVTQAAQSFPSSTLWVSLPVADSQIASASLSDSAAGAQVFGSLVLRCHLDGKAL